MKTRPLADTGLEKDFTTIGHIADSSVSNFIDLIGAGDTALA